MKTFEAFCFLKRLIFVGRKGTTGADSTDCGGFCLGAPLDSGISIGMVLDVVLGLLIYLSTLY